MSFAIQRHRHKQLEASGMLQRGNVWCLGEACPWCILGAQHGDYEAAVRAYRCAIASGTLTVEQHMCQALWHAISDLIEQAQNSGVDLGLGRPGAEVVGLDKNALLCIQLT